MKRNGRVFLEVTFMEEFRCQPIGARCSSSSQCCSGLCENGACKKVEGGEGGDPEEPLDRVCMLEAEVGPCDAVVPRWTYDAELGRCKRFTYGGCGGNANNFKTLEACEKACPPPSPCSLPRVIGPCKAAIPRWWFNKGKGVCERFIYGGCGGNANNFLSKEACEAACKRQAPPCVERACEQRIKAGPCEAAIPLWAFDKSEDRCVEFLWGGCQPNRNNFLTKAECERSCPNPCSRFRCKEDQECRVFGEANTPYCADSCKNRECPDGTSCKLVDVVCITEPCPPVAVCE